MIVRQGIASDVQRVVELSIEFYASVPIASTIPHDEDTAEQVVLYHLDNGFLYVAEQDGVIQGFLIGGLVPSILNRSHYIAAELAWYITPGFRGNSAALRLLRAFELWADDSNASAIALSCLPHTPVSKVYEHHGYRLQEHAYVKGLR